MSRTASPGRPSGGYSAWRLIAEELRGDIGEGILPTGSRLPSENVLSERFGVNRHTARRALAALADEGLVASRRGSGTYVTGGAVHIHRIGLRTRMSRSVSERPGVSSGSRVLAEETGDAPPVVAERLAIPAKRAVRIESIRAIEGVPVAVSTRWFDAERVPGIAAAIGREGSVTRALRACGVDDYLRAATLVSARHATAEESAALEIEAGAVVLVTEATDTLPDGTPLQYLVTRFAAQRVKLDIDHAGSEL